MLRRWISILLALLVLANLAAGPSAALAEVLEHENEALQLDAEAPPVDPAPAHCQHGCVGHFGHHFQWHVSAQTITDHGVNSEAVVAPLDLASPLHIPTLPFRPPLTASIRP